MVHKMPKSGGMQIQTPRTQLTQSDRPPSVSLREHGGRGWGRGSLLRCCWEGAANSLYTEEHAGSGNENESYLWPCIKRLRKYQGKTKIQKETCSKAAEAHSCNSKNLETKQKQTKRPSRMRNCCMSTMGHISAMKWNELTPVAATYMELALSRMREVTQNKSTDITCYHLGETVSCSVVSDSLQPQARTLEWVAIPFSRGSSQARDWTNSIGRI